MAWTKRWGYEMSSKPIRPGIYRLKAGGFFVRARVTDRRTGKMREVSAALHDAKTIPEAQRVLDELVADARAEAKGEIRTKQTWRAFAISRLEERIDRRKMQSEATVDRWKDAIALFVPEWGHLDVRDVTLHHIDLWLKRRVKVWMTEGKTVIRKRRDRKTGELVDKPVTTIIKPPTANGWLRVLRAICHAAKVKFGLAKSAFEGIEFFEEDERDVEDANTLHQDLLPSFMAIARARFPQHFAMILLGFVTGLRPSTLRALRRKGPMADIDWSTGVLQVRRSHSRRQLVMNRPKQKKKGRITLPASVLAELEKHVAALKGKQLESELLFPSETGGFRTRNVLAKPFAAIAAELGLKTRLTPKGMRRTFNDVARIAGVNDVVQMSISGHATDKMRHHYSTAQSEEQRAALERTHALVSGTKDSAPTGEKTGGKEPSNDG